MKIAILIWLILINSIDRFTLAGDLAAIAGREVDLIDIKQIDTVFAMQIFEQGIPIHIRNENEFIRQRMRAYSMYATLNEQRAPIIASIKKRGSVFGETFYYFTISSNFS